MVNINLKEQIKELAMSEGANLVGIAPVESYHDYRGEVKNRIRDTGATLTDFMIPANEKDFFDHISYATNTLPTATSIIMLGVYAYDETAVYRNTYQEIRGNTARIYSYYPVIRHVAEKLTAFIRNLGYNAIHGQNVPLTQ
jgi:epoxyqueuosine reductase QueG